MTSIQRTAIAVLVALLVVFGIYKWGYGRGWGDRDAEMQAVIAKKNEQARQTEAKLAEVTRQSELNLRKAQSEIDKKQSDLTRAIRAGRVRLPAASCVQAPTSATIATGDRDKAASGPDGQADAVVDGPSEQERATLEAIAAIVAQADKNTQQLNACIDAYNNVRNLINGQQ